MRAATKIECFKYWEYVLFHTDNVLVISHQADHVMKYFDNTYTLKSDPKTVNNWYKPSTYIDSKLSKFQVIDTGETLWSMSGDSNIRKAINTV